MTSPRPEKSESDRHDRTRLQSGPPQTLDFSNDTTNPTFGATSPGGVAGFPFLWPPLAADEIGRLGEYRILKKLGEGGMGFVFRAEDPALKRFVALKVMRPEVAAKPQAAERFLREGRAAAGLKSDHIITIYRVGEANGVPYLAMEFLEGLPLDAWIKLQKKPVPPAHALRVVRDTLRGLATAHDKGLIHRDIKPANLWLEKGTSRIKLLDFGLTRGNEGDEQLTQEGAVVGTPAYMAPEQAGGKPVDPRADLFSVGTVMYQLLAGKNPFTRSSVMETLGAIGFEVAPPIASVRPDVPKPYSDFLDRLLAKKPEGRPANAKAALAELAAIEKQLHEATPAPSAAVGVPLVAVPLVESTPQVWDEITENEDAPTRTEGPPKPPFPKKLLLGGGLFAFLAVLGGIIILITNKDGSKTKIEVPDDGTKVEIQKGGKTVASVGGKKEPPKKATMDADRKAAEFVLANGGSVAIGERRYEQKDQAELPVEPFKCTAIDLGSRELGDAEVEMLFKIDGLQWLHLNNYPVTEQILVRLVKLPAAHSISKLQVNASALTDAGLKHFRAFSVLKWLVLTDLRAPGAGLKDWAGWELEILNLNLGAGFVDDNLKFLKDLPKLENITLHGDVATDIGVRHLGDVTSLRDVNFYSTKVSDSGIAALEKLPNVIYLRVEFNGESTLTRECLKSVGRMKTLGCVVLYAPLGDADVKPLLALDGLGEVHLNVRNAEFTDTGLMNLSGIKLLHSLQVERSRVTPDGVRKFRAARPEVKIVGELLAKADPDRAAAEFVVRKGGSVVLAGGDRVDDVKNLPAVPFKIVTVRASAVDTMTDQDLEIFRHLDSLSDLVVAGPITDDGVAKLSEFPFVANINSLSIRSSNLTDAGIGSASRFPNLVVLHAGSPKVTGDGLTRLKGSKIQVLGLGGSKIVDSDLPSLKNLPALRELALDATPLTDAGIKVLGGFDNLEILIIADCPNITDAGIKHLSGLRKLTYLDIDWKIPGDGPLTPASFEAVGKMTELKCLSAHINATADANLKQLVNLQKLEILRINTSGLTDAGLETLARIKTLKELNLKGSKVTAAGVTKFKAAVPACKVLSDFDAAADPDRAAAEALKPHCVSLGLKMPSGERRYLKRAEPLPDGRFELTEAFFSGQVSALPPGFEADVLLPRLAPLRSFEVLRDPGGIFLKLTEKELKALADAPVGASLVTLSLPIRLSPGSLAQFRRFPKLGEFIVDLRDADEELILKLNEFPKVWTIGLDHFDPPTQATEKVCDMVRKLRNAHFMISESKSMTKPLAEAIGDNPSFKTLYFWNTPVADDLLPVLFAGGKIASSTFAFTGLTDEGMKQIGRVSTLEILALVGAKGVTDAGLGELKGLKALRQIEIVGTKVTAEGVKKLKAALPACQVTSDFDAAAPVVDVDRAAAEKLLPTFDLDILPAGTMETVKLKAGSPVPAGAFAVVGVRCWAAEALPKSFADDVLFPAIAPLTRLVLLEDSGSKLDMGKADPAKWAGLAAKDTLQNFELAVPLSDGWIDVFRQFPKLAAVHVHEARKVPAATLKRLSELKALDSLRIGAVAGSDRWDAITALPLKKLGVSVAPNMDAAACARIAAMPALDSVPFYDIAFTAEMLAALAPAPKLRSLTFTKCKLPATGYEHLARMPNLGALNIKGNEFGDAQLAQFGEAKTVQFLSVKDTAVTEAGVKALAAKRPNLTIEWKGGRYRDGR